MGNTIQDAIANDLSIDQINCIGLFTCVRTYLVVYRDRETLISYVTSKCYIAKGDLDTPQPLSPASLVLG